MAGKKRRKTDGYDRNVFRMLTMISQFGINMIVPMCMCFFVGYFLDQRLGTSYLSVIGFFIGALAGFRNIYVFSSKMLQKNDRAGKSRGVAIDVTEPKEALAQKQKNL